MPETRKRRGSPKGLAAGEKLQRNLLADIRSATWGWIANEVHNASDISEEHILEAYGLGKRSPYLLCSNKYASSSKETLDNTSTPAFEHDEDVVIVSESTTTCSKGTCRNNPNCLNYLGQEKWEKEKTAKEMFLKATKSKEDPRDYQRDPTVPVGLKNLGATCYANAFLQVWFQDLAFRAGVYQCQANSDDQQKFEDSPVFQLQVTFAALQESRQVSFNPIKLMESLQLPMSEQQDAQEFSKLFMSHLDSEFRKQALPSLKTLLPSQFEGQLTYATVCEKCKSRSERQSNFLELEVNLENNAKLEDRLAALLAPERLTDDNKYLCYKCETLENATRYTELKDLPPVLHISLLRFVYDITTYERKKSKHTVIFPAYLDMSRFLSCAGSSTNKENVYELRGVLLHKGSSAYHGHYEAQVYDTIAKQWYQFDDEDVSLIPSFHAPDSPKDKRFLMNGKKEKTNQVKKLRKDSRRKVIEDSDDESEKMIAIQQSTKNLTSKDAYMLIYARCNDKKNTNEASEMQTVSNELLIPKPPPRALEVVEDMNKDYEDRCEVFSQDEDALSQEFAERCTAVKDIYQSWAASQASINENYNIISSMALEKWLQRAFSRAKVEGKEAEDQVEGPSLLEQADEELPDKLTPRSPEKSNDNDPITSKEATSNESITCHHGLLNPLKSGQMKRIRSSAYEKIKALGHRIEPEFTMRDVCRQCVEDEFSERLYQIEHPRVVQQFDEVCDPANENEGFWISKAWLKDWRITKPKMHIRAHADPDPDSSEFLNHVKCEHGCLSMNTTARRRISAASVEVLRPLFPSWKPLLWNAEVCAVCDAQAYLSKEDKLEMRKKAENEKALLKRLQEADVFGRKAHPPGIECAVISSDFIKSWRAWLLKPTDTPCPTSIDNSRFFCEHDELIVDLSIAADMDDELVMVTESEWETLQEFYSGGPTFMAQIVVDITEDGNTQEKLTSDLKVCGECRRKRCLAFDITFVTIAILKSSESVPLLSSDDIRRDPQYRELNEITSYFPPISHKQNGSTVKAGNGIRQSKRIRENKVKERWRRVRVRKTTTVRELKIMLQKELSIPTISQQLFYLGQELDDNTQTIAKLEILQNDIIFLREVDEGELVVGSEDEAAPPSKKRTEGKAFHGTLLTGGRLSPVLDSRSSRASSTDIHDIEMNDPPDDHVYCPACTFANPPHSLSCSMCETLFTELNDNLVV